LADTYKTTIRDNIMPQTSVIPRSLLQQTSRQAQTITRPRSGVSASTHAFNLGADPSALQENEESPKKQQDLIHEAI
jgi:hypothetical protein